VKHSDSAWQKNHQGKRVKSLTWLGKNLATVEDLQKTVVKMSRNSSFAELSSPSPHKQEIKLRKAFLFKLKIGKNLPTNCPLCATCALLFTFVVTSLFHHLWCCPLKVCPIPQLYHKLIPTLCHSPSPVSSCNLVLFGLNYYKSVITKRIGEQTILLSKLKVSPET